MSSFKQLLLTLNMLSQDMTDELSKHDGKNSLVSDVYIELLKQYLNNSKTLSELAKNYTNIEFKVAIQNRGLCLHLLNKKMLLIQNRLLEYIIDYFEASFKLEKIRDADFSEQANIRFDLLSVRAIKSKAQFKTVSEALSDSEYNSIVEGVSLPDLNWR